MPNLVRFRDFLSAWQVPIILSAVFVFVLIFSFSSLTTKPRIWVDETVTLELARGFSSAGVLDIQTTPGGFSGFPQLLQSTGYTLTVPLAGIFRIFGYDFSVVRIFMLVLMIAMLLAVFFFSRKIFGERSALLTVFLLASFSSFYGSGRTAVGEIPGFLFLILAMHFWLNRNAYYVSGIFLGLAVVTKPAVFLLVLPAIASAFFIGNPNPVLNLFRLAVATAPAALGWIFFVLRNPFSSEIWKSLLSFYRNPYSSDIYANVAVNLSNFIHSSTLIYFSALFFLIAAGYFISDDKKIRSFFGFTVVYCFLAFAYYLRSPGWLRYILIGEFLIFISLPAAVSGLFSRYGKLTGSFSLSAGQVSATFCLALVIIQFMRLFNGAQIFHSDSEIRAAGYINSNFPDRSVGVIDSPKLSVLLTTDSRYQTITLAGIPRIGGVDFLIGHIPEVLAFGTGQIFSENEAISLDKYYSLITKIDGYEIYGKN